MMNKSLNRYLYAIRTLKEKYLCVRAVDLAHYLGVSKASVSISIGKMKDQRLIETESDGNLLFTAAGLERADLLSSRISFFRHILTGAGVDPAQALRDAISFSWEMSEFSYEAFQHLLTEQTGKAGHRLPGLVDSGSPGIGTDRNPDSESASVHAVVQGVAAFL